MADLEKKGKKSLNLTGSANKTYNLDELSTKNTRGDSEAPLVIQVLDSDPVKPKVGQIWLIRNDK